MINAHANYFLGKRIAINSGPDTDRLGIITDWLPNMESYVVLWDDDESAFIDDAGHTRINLMDPVSIIPKWDLIKTENYTIYQGNI